MDVQPHYVATIPADYQCDLSPRLNITCVATNDVQPLIVATIPAD